MSRGAVGRAERLNENAKIFVAGRDVNGNPFQEETEIHDISETGASFYLKTPIWRNSHLTVGIESSQLFGPFHKTAGMVVRVYSEGSERQFVAMRFD